MFPSFFQYKFLLLFLMLPLMGIAQNEANYFEKLEEAREKDDLIGYVTQLEDLARLYKKKYVKKDSLRWHYSLSTYQKYPLFRTPNNKSEVGKSRKYYANLLYIMSQKNGKNDVWLENALNAHKLLKDRDSLDKYAFYIENSIGHQYAEEDDYNQALVFYRKTADYYKNTSFDAAKLSRIYSDIANCYSWLNQNEKCLLYFRKGLALAQESKSNKAWFANIGKYRSFALKLGNEALFDSLSILSLEFLESYSILKDKQKREVSLLVDQAKMKSLKKDYTTAIKLLKKAQLLQYQIYPDKNRRELAKTTLQLGKNYLKLCNTVTVDSLIRSGFSKLIPEFGQQALPDEDQIYAENTLIDLIFLWVESKKACKSERLEEVDFRQIAKALDLAFQVNELLRQNMAIDDAKYASTELSRAIINRQVDNYFQLKDLNSIRQCFNRSKNTIHNEYIWFNESLSSLNPHIKDSIQFIQENIRKSIAKRGQIGNIDSINALIYEWKQRLKPLQESLPKPLLVPIEGDYLEYLISEEQVYLLLNVNNIISIHALGSPQDLSDLMKKAQYYIGEKIQIDSCNIALDCLSAFLLPAQIQLPAAFTYIPDGILTQLPFDILRRNGRYLIEKHQIETKHHYLNLQTPPLQLDGSLLSLSPDYPDKDGKKSEERGGIYPLPHAQMESQAVAQQFGERGSTLSNLSKEALVQELTTKDFFHFAGHAISKGDSVYLVLNPNGQNQRWTQEEILHEHLQLELVTLSACETGLGVLKEGDGIASMGRAFLGSGAKAVLFSLWNVNDQSAPKLIGDFYKGIQHSSIEEALREAKLRYLKTASPEARHPYYWGSFVAIDTSQQKSMNYWKWVFLFLIITSLIVLLTKQKTMKNLILVFALILSSTAVFGQTQDRQWFITHNGVASNAQNSSTILPNANNQDYKIYNVSHPYIVNPNNDIQGRNDVFIIFSDGTYFNSREITYDEWVEPLSTGDKGYQLDISNISMSSNPITIDYLYFTNVYEEDDPIDALQIANDQNNLDGNWTINMGEGTSSNALSANHDLARNKDITLIIDSRNLSEDCSSRQPVYTLCFNEISGNSQYALNLSESAVFNGSAYHNIEPNVIFNEAEKCIENILLTDSVGYINLRVPNDFDHNLIGEELRFKLYESGLGFSSPCTDLTETIRNSHDPNYLELLCVEEQCDKQFAKYYIQCVNVGDLSVDEVEMDLYGLVGGVIEDVQLIGGTSGSSITGNPDSVLLYFDCNNQHINIKFTNGIDGINQSPNNTEEDLNNRTAKATFCVELSNVNLELDMLAFGTPTTNFIQGGDQFWAIEYQYLCELRETEELFMPPIPSQGPCNRATKDNCGCSQLFSFNFISLSDWLCIFKQNPVISGVGSILIAGFLILINRRRNRRNRDQNIN